jgi:tetratricopeptide (TPR) repeat protein
MISFVGRKLGWTGIISVVFAGACLAQTGAIEGDVKGEDGNPMKGAQIRILRKDIKGNYAVKTDKKGHFFHTGLPLGMYKVWVEVDGKEVDSMDNVRTRLGDPVEVSFDLSEIRKRREAMTKAMESGQLTDDQKRSMSAEQRAALDKQMKERSAAMAKNKALNDAFNTGMEAKATKNWDQAIQAFGKAAEIDPKQHVIFGNLAESYMGLATTKPAAEQQPLLDKAFENYNKALELKPDDAAYHNNYALALAKAKKLPEMQAELEKAVALDPPGAGRYYFNLGAVLTNAQQTDAACDAFKKAYTADPNYAEAHYQYGLCLTSKATATPDGKMVFPDGTKEAFEKYLALTPNGPNAESAKGMLAAMGSTIQTEYKNPSAEKNPKKATKKK